MQHWEQFEVWIPKDGKWEMAGWFHEFDVASNVARSRRSNVRLTHAVYEDGRMVNIEVLAEIGGLREHP